MLTSKSSVWRCPSVWLVAEGSRRRGSRALSSWRTLREYRARNSELGVPRFSPADRQAIPTARQASIVHMRRGLEIDGQVRSGSFSVKSRPYSGPRRRHEEPDSRKLGYQKLGFLCSWLTTSAKCKRARCCRSHATNAHLRKHARSARAFLCVGLVCAADALHSGPGCPLQPRLPARRPAAFDSAGAPPRPACAAQPALEQGRCARSVLQVEARFGCPRRTAARDSRLTRPGGLPAAATPSPGPGSRPGASIGPGPWSSAAGGLPVAKPPATAR